MSPDVIYPSLIGSTMARGPTVEGPDLRGFDPDPARLAGFTGAGVPPAGSTSESVTGALVEAVRRRAGIGRVP
ncbi:MAG TPA: hypothetical protein VK969_02400 [Acidimicrobiia bacterium]|nr:hypothetical protein [Acidimicrobiia bacterium]